MLCKSIRTHLFFAALLLSNYAFASEDNTAQKEKTQDCLSLYMPHFFTRMAAGAQQSLKDKTAVTSYLACVRRKCLLKPMGGGWVETYPMPCMFEPALSKEKNTETVTYSLENPCSEKGCKSFTSEEQEYTHKQWIRCTKNIKNSSITCSLSRFIDLFPGKESFEYRYPQEFEWRADRTASPEDSLKIFTALESLHKLQRERRSILKFNQMAYDNFKNKE